MTLMPLVTFFGTELFQSWTCRIMEDAHEPRLGYVILAVEGRHLFKISELGDGHHVADDCPRRRHDNAGDTHQIAMPGQREQVHHLAFEQL
jgi:hypothetical protein